jgi:cytochrome P450
MLMVANIDIDSSTFLSKEYSDNPYPTLKLLRDQQPVYYNPLIKQWMVTRYEDVMNIFADTENFSASPNGDHIGAVFGPTLMEFDGEEHRKLRGVVAPEFVGMKLQSLLPIVQRNAMALVQKRRSKVKLTSWTILRPDCR